MFKKIAALLAISLLLLPGAIFAQGQGGDNGQSPVFTPSPTVEVDCDNGQTIQDAVNRIPTPTTIMISGHCVESVSVHFKGDITFNNAGNAVVTALSGSQPAFSIHASRDISINDLEINGMVYAAALSHVSLQRNKISNPTNTGVVVTLNSYAGIGHNDLDGNGGGISVTKTSSVVVDSNKIRNSVSAGIGVSFSSSATFRNNNITNNGTYGFTVGQNSSLHFQGLNTIEGHIFGVLCGGSGAILVSAAQNFSGNTLNLDQIAGCDLVAFAPFP